MSGRKRRGNGLPATKADALSEVARLRRRVRSLEYDEAHEEFVPRANASQTGGLVDVGRAGVRKGEGVVGRMAIALGPVQVPDIAVAGAYESRSREALLGAGVRAILAVPMLHEGRLLGGFAVSRNQPGTFPPETVDLLRTFATQSALAIQNARLFHQLEAANQHKSAFLASILDLMMPVMDGFEFLAELRREDAWRGIPVIVLTAKDLSAEDRERLNGSVTRILQKGAYGREALLAEVRALVGASVERRASAR